MYTSHLTKGSGIHSSIHVLHPRPHPTLVALPHTTYLALVHYKLCNFFQWKTIRRTFLPIFSKIQQYCSTKTKAKNFFVNLFSCNLANLFNDLSFSK